MIHSSAGQSGERKLCRALRPRMLGCTPITTADYGGNAVRRNTSICVAGRSQHVEGGMYAELRYQTKFYHQVSYEAIDGGIRHLRWP